MNSNVSMKKFVAGDRHDVFNYWLQPDLLEQWASPEGMKLKVPFFEAREGGSYRFEHTGEDGVYSCDGYVKELIPDEKLVMVDTIKKPDGSIMYDGLVSTVHFKDAEGGTEISLSQIGFNDPHEAEECQTGWIQSFDQLSSIFESKSESRDNRPPEVNQFY